MKRIVMAGITGRTGKAVANVLRRLDDCQIVAAVGKNSAGRDIGELLEGKRNFRYIYPDVPSALEKTDADVYIDFTAPDAVQENAASAIKHGLDIIVGTTGLAKESVEWIAELLREEKRFGIIASNFAIGIAAMVENGKNPSRILWRRRAANYRKASYFEAGLSIRDSAIFAAAARFNGRCHHCKKSGREGVLS